MTTITFKPDSAHQFVDWNDPARWTGGVVPNDPAVDVIIPTTTVVSTGNPYFSYIREVGAITVGSLMMSNNYLLLDGTMTVVHDLNISAGGEIDLRGGQSLFAGSIDNNGFDIQGVGSVNVTGLFLNETRVVGTGLSLTAGSLTNPGSLIASSGNLTVTVTHGGFTNLSGSTLTGGSYQAGFSGNLNPNILYLDVGGVIATDAANISLSGGGAIYSFDDVANAYVSIQSSMHSIAASGTLSLTSQAFTWSDLTVDGSISLLNATLNATQLTLDPGGTVSGTGTLGGPIANSGAIVAELPDSNTNQGLLLTGLVTGPGVIEIAEALRTAFNAYRSAPLEIAAAASSNVLFDDGHGTVRFDDVAEFSGKIRPAAAGDQIILTGISFGSVTGYSYSGDSHGGTLAIQTTGGETDLQFLGNFTTANFSLAVGPQKLSSDPESLLITNTGSAPTVLAPIAEDSGARLITQSELLAGFVGSSPVASDLAITSGNGTLVNNNDGTWSYTPAQHDDTGVSFSYNVTYSGGTVPESATLDITPQTLFDQPAVELAASFNPANGWTSQDQFPRNVADVNGDGSADIVGFGNGGVYVSLANGDGSFAPLSIKLAAFNPANGWTSDNSFHRELADVNGDHMADIIGFGNGGVYVALATGDGNFAPLSINLAAFNPANGWTSQDQFPRELADVNGDGMADIVAFGNSGVYVSLATGGGNFAPQQVGLAAALNPANGWTSQDQFPRELADVNGDGMADIVGFGNGGVYVALATGGGNFAPFNIELAALNPANGWTSNNQFPRELADINHDGMADIVGFGNGGVYVALATGGGHFASPIIDIAAFNPAHGWSSNDAFPRELADVNHDGQADIVGFGNPGVLVALAHNFLLS